MKLTNTLTLTRDPAGPTPVELHDGRWYKRDDLLGYSNGVNGKVRTALHLARLATASGASALIYGGSVRAPALGRVASAAAVAALDCYLVIGSQPETAVKHPTVRVAVDAGARLLVSRAPYNPALQKKVRDVVAASNGAIYPVPYAVSTAPEATVEEVRAFLECDAGEVTNLPDEIRTLVISLGSGNAASGVLYGLATRGAPRALERVVLVGLGPAREEWLEARLALVGVRLADLPFEIVRMTTYPDFAIYSDLMHEQRDGITFHPTYEGKLVRYLDRLAPAWWTRRDGTTALWIVGGPLGGGS